jgi:hypothetical protein
MLKKEMHVARYPGIIKWCEENNIVHYTLTYSLSFEPSRIMIEIENDNPIISWFKLRWL